MNAEATETKSKPVSLTQKYSPPAWATAKTRKKLSGDMRRAMRYDPDWQHSQEARDLLAEGLNITPYDMESYFPEDYDKAVPEEGCWVTSTA